MRISSSFKALAAAAGVLLAGGVLASQPAVAGPPQFVSQEEALRQGVSAYNGGYYEIAIPALEHAAAANNFLAQYYLARLYADNSSAHTDHAKAYMLFQKIANDHADADPEDDVRAPYVAKALTALAGYVRLGMSEIGLKPNPELAAEYLHHAATFFNDEDAQFELSKMHLRGEGVRADVARGKHWLSILAQKGHAGAQAFLADLYWRGRFMPHDPVRALALISVAVKNAPPMERVWIDDIHQNIYCGASEGVRRQVTGMVAEWDRRYGRKPRLGGGESLGQLDARPVRTCANGEPVPLNGEGSMIEPRPAIEASQRPSAIDSLSGGSRSDFATGSMGLRSVGAVRDEPVR